jgi:C4-type Zn-finger protein
VILLTFPPVFGEVSTETPERPVAKCAVCGYRLTAAEVADQEEPPPD